MAPDTAVARQWIAQRLDRLRPKSASSEAPGTPKPRVAVVTDSAAALPPEWVAQHNGGGHLTVVPMPVIIGEDVFSDDDTELETHISLALAAGAPVRTSRPSPGQFERAYQAAEREGFESIVSIHISTKLSGTFEAAQLAASRAGIPVQVIDSGTAAMAQGMAVQAAVAVAASGGSAEEVLAAARATAATTTVIFYVPSLEQLRRGGRISFASSWLGTVLDIKPLLGMRDGMVVPLEKVRSAAKAIARMEALALAELASRDPARVQLSLHYFGNETQAVDLEASLRSFHPDLPVLTLTRLSGVLAAHVGLGVLAVVVGDSFLPQEELTPPQGLPEG